ncbi:MAG: sulfatase [Candidatus Curtissbacteria bacterium]|nr:sulfatase [Candidatus Curtissbacteria bacterium]
MVKRILLVFVLVILFLFIGKTAGKLPRSENFSACRGCNVVLISVDTLRQDHLSLYGYGRKTSPNLDEFAKNARVYQNFYSSAPWTLPSFASLFTSDYPQNIKMQIGTDVLAEKYTTIAEVLNENGYETVGINSATFVSKARGFSQGFDSFRSFEPKENHQDIDLIIPEAMKWLGNNRSKKFFMFLHTFQVHDPYCPPGEFDQFGGDLPSATKCVDVNMIAKNNRGEKVLPIEELERFVSLYDGEILFTDYMLGELFKTLGKLNLDKKTIVIVTADHGEEFGERGNWGVHSYSLYNELIRVPLIIKAPNFDPGREEKPASIVDIAPTILDLVGLQKSVEFKGTSLRNIGQDHVVYAQTSNVSTVNRYLDRIYSEVRSIPLKIRGAEAPITRESVMQNGWKLIADNTNGKKELYDMRSDPLEKNNLAGNNLEQETKLLELMLRFKEENTDQKSTLEEDIKGIFDYIISGT